MGAATTRDKGPDLRSKSRERLQAEIVEVAFNVFAERGFDQVTAAEVAERLGVDGDDIKVEALIGGGLGAASTRWAQSDGAEDPDRADRRSLRGDRRPIPAAG